MRLTCKWLDKEHAFQLRSSGTWLQDMAFEGQRTSKLLTHAPATNAQVRVCTLTHPTKPHNVGASKQSCCQREKVWQQPGHTELQQQLGPLPAAVQRLAMCPGMQARLQARRRVLYTLSVDPNNRQQFDPNNLTSGAKRRQAGQPTFESAAKGRCGCRRRRAHTKADHR